MKSILLGLSILALLGCAKTKLDKEELGKVLKENPQLLASAIEANSKEFNSAFTAVSKSLTEEKDRLAKLERQKQNERYFTNPLKPDLTSQSFLGDTNAQVTIVKYTDFQCGFCARAAGTLDKVLDDYKGKVRLTVKHFPLNFHKQAKDAARYFEGIRQQNEEAAWKFYHALYENSDKIKTDGVKYFRTKAKEFGVNLTTLKKALKSKSIDQKIEADMKEASTFGFSGTPNMLVGGVPVRGAQPYAQIAEIIDRHLTQQAG